MRDPHDPLAPLRRLLEGSWHLFRLFGIEIRLYWTAALVFAIATWQWTRWPGVGFLEAVALGLAFQAGLYVLVLLHELAHAAAAYRYRIRTPRITLSALGGLAHIAAPPPGPRAEMAIAAAGPASHLPWIALSFALEGVVPPLRVGAHGLPVDVLWYLRYVNVVLALFNLLPFFPMDGGRVLRGLLALRVHANWATVLAARVGVVGAIALMAWGMTDRGFSGTLLLLIGLNNLQACLGELRAGRWTEGPYAPVDEFAFHAQDPDAWKQGGYDPGDPGRSLGQTERDPPVRPRDRPRERPTPDDAELDALLEKVGRVGLTGLTEAERRRLHDISARRRPG